MREPVGADALLGIPITISPVHDVGPDYDEPHVAERALLVGRDDEAGMTVRLGRNCPVVPGREFDIHVMAKDNRIQKALLEAEEAADNNLYVCSNEGFLNLFELVEIAASGAGRIDKGVNAFPKHQRHFRGQSGPAARLMVNLVRDARQQVVIRMTRNDYTCWYPLAQMHPPRSSRWMVSTSLNGSEVQARRLATAELAMAFDTFSATARATGGGKALPTCR